ncbi:molybdenum cofactor biosynthesis protein MoaE [Flavihumibacter petaseus]|uniref:Molybdopterin synthase catalytic subunit n=1 Tax=Flavihumibacter petaseus NBRC 106054 TaxID=1220578 RepID=A0A0E9N3N5_9BACT|nr:molybdenum cofactor biosynthesis protein MoaE [Flavihumibacter petaseus]GAO44424.1 molybdopterin synthase large subunit [Flavihumibacter petaseus NBRC 106054]
MHQESKIREIFQEGPILPEQVAASLQAHQHKKQIGAHSMFMGQVRADQTPQGIVAGIEYTTYRDMALEQMHQIREEIFAKFGLTCMHVHHSLGWVPAGAISLFVFTSSPHRKAAIEACAELVERIKKELPVWGKEVLEGEGHQWKSNN